MVSFRDMMTLEESSWWFYVLLHFGFLITYVLVGMLDPGPHLTGAYIFAIASGTGASIIQALCLWAWVHGYPLTTVAHAGYFFLTTNTWGWFATIGQSNVLSDSPIGVGWRWSLIARFRPPSVTLLADPMLPDSCTDLQLGLRQHDGALHAVRRPTHRGRPPLPQDLPAHPPGYKGRHAIV